MPPALTRSVMCGLPVTADWRNESDGTNGSSPATMISVGTRCARPRQRRRAVVVVGGIAEAEERRRVFLVELPHGPDAVQGLGREPPGNAAAFRRIRAFRFRTKFH
jgi:hypothetical protein